MAPHDGYQDRTGLPWSDEDFSLEKAREQVFAAFSLAGDSDLLRLVPAEMSFDKYKAAIGTMCVFLNFKRKLRQEAALFKLRCCLIVEAFCSDCRKRFYDELNYANLYYLVHRDDTLWSSNSPEAYDTELREYLDWACPKCHSDVVSVGGKWVTTCEAG